MKDIIITTTIRLPIGLYNDILEDSINAKRNNITDENSQNKIMVKAITHYYARKKHPSKDGR